MKVNKFIILFEVVSRMLHTQGKGEKLKVGACGQRHSIYFTVAQEESSYTSKHISPTSRSRKTNFWDSWVGRIELILKAFLFFLLNPRQEKNLCYNLWILLVCLEQNCYSNFHANVDRASLLFSLGYIFSSMPMILKKKMLANRVHP